MWATETSFAKIAITKSEFVFTELIETAINDCIMMAEEVNGSKSLDGKGKNVTKILINKI